MTASLRLIDELDGEIDACQRELRRLGADHPYMSLLRTMPGIGWVLADTIASEIGDIARFESPKKLVGYTGLCPYVYQSGGTDRRGRIAKNGPPIFAGHSSRRRSMPARVRSTSPPMTAPRRVGRARGGKVARVELGRKLAEAMWQMLTKGEQFAPARSQATLVA